MKTLIWKEWREQRVWTILVTASTTGLVALGAAYTFSGNLSTFTRMTWLSFAVALLLGASSFSRELRGDTVDFAYSRPVSWKRILLAKMTVGMGIIAFAAISAAIVYRLVAPDEYIRLLTLSRLAQGIGAAIALMGSAYLIGVACSVVLPGTIGGILTLMVALLLLGVTAHALRLGGSVLQFPDYWLPAWLGLGWVVGILGASVMTLRYGITLPAGARAKRYAAFFVVTLLLSACLDLGWPTDAMTHRFGDGYVKSSVSPDGRYALLDRANSREAVFSGLIPGGGYWRLIRLSDGAVSDAEKVSVYVDFHWKRPDGLLLVKYQRDIRIEDIRMDHSGNLIRRSVSVGSLDADPHVSPIPSPSGNLVALHTYFMEDPLRNYLELIDVDSMRKLDRRIDLQGWRPGRWKTDKTFELWRIVNGNRRWRTIDVSAVEEGTSRQ